MSDAGIAAALLARGPESPLWTMKGMIMNPETTVSPAIEAEGLAADIREALRAVVDPEINLDIVTLGLVREILLQPDHGAEVRMILTTPFCPYAGTLVQQAKDVASRLVEGPVTITLLDEPRWTPDMMEGGDWSEWGLV